MNRRKPLFLVAIGVICSLGVLFFSCWFASLPSGHHPARLRFQRRPNRWVNIWREGRCVFGDLDANGSFIEDVQLEILGNNGIMTVSAASEKVYGSVCITD